MDIEEEWANQLNAIHQAETKRQAVPLHTRLPHLREELVLWKGQLLRAIEQQHKPTIQKHGIKIIHVRTELLRATLLELRQNPLYTKEKEYILISSYQNECSTFIASIHFWLI